MITGIHLAKNVKLIFRASDKKEKEAAVTIPVAELLGDPGILGKVLDVGGSVTWDSSDSDSQSFEADEFIYGVNYTKVKVHFYSPKDLEKLPLSTDSVWKYMSTDAGEDENSDEEAVNMVNLELAESSEVNAEEGTVYEEDFEFPGSQSG
jgi:predicted nucleotidyltransferase